MNELPLFTLHTVLYPGGRLPLRVFESRYRDMISKCLKAERPFGVCLIRSGQEVGKAAEPHAVGTEAHVVACDLLQPGILGITVRGGRRFVLGRTWAEPDELLVGEVALLPEEQPLAVSAAHRQLAQLLVEVLKQVGEQNYFAPVRADDAVWVSYRLAELWPLPKALKQQLLEQSDVGRRLDLLAAATGMGSERADRTRDHAAH